MLWFLCRWKSSERVNDEYERHDLEEWKAVDKPNWGVDVTLLAAASFTVSGFSSRFERNSDRRYEL